MHIINIKDIQPYVKNAKKHPKKQVDAIVESIKRFGFNQPIVVDKDNIIVVGHGRYEAAKQLGYGNVPVIKADKLTKAEANAYRLADNKLNESDWNMDLVIPELKELDEDLQELTGFDKDLLIEPDEKDDEVPPLPEKPKSKLGDIYLLDNHRVMCGDSTKAEDVEKLMDGKKADMVFTDPPYGMFLETDFSKIEGSEKSIGFKGNLKGNKYDKVIGDNEDFTPELIDAILSFNTKETFIWGADYFIDLLPNHGKDGCLLVWNKRSSDAQQKGIGNCFELFWSKQQHKKYVFNFEWFGFLSKDAPDEARNRMHPTMKPIGLIERIWKWYKSPEGIVVDIYLGSGSTLIAAEKTGRICYGMELDPKYVDVIVKRWEDYTGNKAEKV